jgi:hypothetical protein
MMRQNGRRMIISAASKPSAAQNRLKFTFQMEGHMMKKILMCLSLIAVLITSAMAADIKKSDFEVKTTQSLINLCTASPEDPLFTQAANFCHGYLVGAFHYYAASVAGESAAQFVCLPDKRPSRDNMIAMFVKWAQDHPQYMNELPVETEFRFLSEKWPCN